MIPERILKSRFRLSLLCYPKRRLIHHLCDLFRLRARISSRIHDHPVCLLKRRPADMAVSARVFLQIPLMILLRFIKRLQRSDLHLKRRVPLPLDLRDPHNSVFRCLVGKIDPGLILGPMIVSLPVLHCWIDHAEKRKQQSVQTHLRRIILHADGLPVAGSSG